MVIETRPSLVVQTLLSGGDFDWFDRWFDAVVSSLAGAHEDGALGDWRIVATCVRGEEEVDAPSLAPYERRATLSGGEFSLLFLNTDPGDEKHNCGVLETGDEDLILLLDSGSLILRSTVVRMLRALTSDLVAVGARELPLDQFVERGSETVSVHDEHEVCVLYSRSALREPSEVVVNSGAESSSPVRLGGVPSSYCPSAVVFRDRRVSFPAEPLLGSGGDVGGQTGSLLEDMISNHKLDVAREIIAGALTGTDGPLVSVVMRTQVRRPEALRDSLLCLAGQSDGRFELLLVVHDSDPEDARHILDDQPEWLKSRTRILTASGGTRSHPLNVGIAAARGTHVAFLDDDDLVFAHWVESFLAASIEHPRRVLRASAGVQGVRTTTWQGGVGGHMSESPISTPYPRAFNLADHLRVNMTPFMAFAFPRGFFAVFGGADDSLEVCEDWDLVLRAASVLGVTDVPALTAIYRRWSSGDDSYSVHESAIWERDMARVHSKLDSSVLLLPAGSASELVRFSATVGVSAELAAVYGSSSWRITAPMRATARWTRRIKNRVVTLFTDRGD